MSRYRDALGIGEFRAVFGAHIASTTGAVTANFALVMLLYARTGSPLLSSLVFTLVFTPHLIAGTLLSALIDRLPVRRLLVTSNLLSASLVLVISWDGTPTPVVFPLAFALGMIEPVFAGARAATLPQVLPGESYVSGRSLMRLVSQFMQVGGFALGGLLLIRFTPDDLLRINAACFVISALVLRLGTMERRPPAGTVKPTSLLQDSLAGLGAVWRVAPVRRVLALGWLVPAIAVAAEAMAAPYSAGLAKGAFGAGLMLAAAPLGAMLGELLGNWLLSPERQKRLIVPLAALVFAPMPFFLLQPGLPVAVPLLFVSGFGFSMFLGQDRLLLEVVPEPIQARALSIQTAGLMFWQGVGFAAAGAMGQWLPPGTVVVTAGALGLCGVAWFAARRVQAPAVSPVGEDA